MDALSREFALARKEFDAILDRLEDAQRGNASPFAYGPLENQADVAAATRFVTTWWEFLEHRQQHAYLQRLAFLKALGRRRT